ncbi:unnamed protein product [Enterobius vermicularis]|uniref:VWFA domain-containing protein n=1 Tax=Enterobius vermicularis TaxID=51028 RepID=A0A3P6HBS2_ENTVE|nr:unnamed protein product [Enterobius vermicularis]
MTTDCYPNPPTTKPSSTTPPAPQPSPEEKILKNLKRDFIIVTDMIPSANDNDKKQGLKSFLEGFGKLLELNETFSRIALIGFDAKGIVYIGQFAESQTTYSANIGKLMAAEATGPGYGKLTTALNEMLKNDSKIELRPYTDAIIIVVTDNIPADPDTLIRSIKVTISHLQYSGYHLSAITPTSNFVRAVFKNLFNNEHLVSGNQILSYKNLGSEGVAFAKKQALAFVDIDPLPTTVAKVSRIDIKPMISIAEAINKGQSDVVPTTAEPTSSIKNCLDVIILMDRSQSILEDVYNSYTKQFLITLAEQFDFTGESNKNGLYSRIGVIQYATDADLTIDLEKRSRENFTNLVTRLVSYNAYRGMSNIQIALEKAVDVFRDRKYTPDRSENIGTALILFSDGGVSYGQQPYSIAERLRASGTTIIAVVVQGSDPYDDADHQSLLNITGGNERYLFEALNNKDYTVDLAENLTDAIPCPNNPTQVTVPTSTTGTLPDSYHCNPFIFVIETTELLQKSFSKMFNAAKKIAELFDSYHLNTTFLLVTYSSPEKTALHNDNGPETLSKFAERIDNLMNNTDLLLPYFDGSTYLSSGIKFAQKAIDVFKNDPTYAGSPYVIFMGEADKGEISDKDQVPNEARKLHQLTPYVFMVDLTSTKNSDQELLKNVVSKDSYIIGEPRRSATEDSISKNTIRKVFGLWTDTVCAPPKIGSCLTNHAADVTVVIHCTRNETLQNEINNLAATFVSAMNMFDDQFHIGVVTYELQEAIAKDVGVYKLDELKHDIKKIRCSRFGDSISGAFEYIYNASHAYNSYSQKKRRRFANQIETETEHKFSNIAASDVKIAQDLLNKWKAEDCRGAPIVRLISINLNEFTVPTVVQNFFGGLKEMQLGNFESAEQADQTTYTSVHFVRNVVDTICRWTDDDRAG